MKNQSLFLIATICLVVLIAGCSKSTTGPLDCHIGFKIRFLDKNTGGDLGVDGAGFLDSIRITEYEKTKDFTSGTGQNVFINRDISDTAVYYSFIANPIDFCNESLYSISREAKYIISYADDIQSDSIVLWIEKNNSKLMTTYSFNGTTIGVISIDDFHNSSSRKNLPTINIKK